jgi:hypothetical protein
MSTLPRQHVKKVALIADQTSIRRGTPAKGGRGTHRRLSDGGSFMACAAPKKAAGGGCGRRRSASLGEAPMGP